MPVKRAGPIKRAGRNFLLNFKNEQALLNEQGGIFSQIQKRSGSIKCAGRISL